MARRHLSSDEQALWNALARSVRPLRPGTRLPEQPSLPLPASGAPTRLKGQPPAPMRPDPPRTPAKVLDANWERRIRGGTLTPDMTIDLHGHSLSAAHVRLNQSLATALTRDARVMLIVTGKPPKSGGSGGDPRRGAIRGEIGHWLETSSYADRIASVRLAHPRHGGDGAIYVILRRKK
ncbi:Smr/MutS family protein [Sphingobium vermicomposti]|uniref:DNA-nicking Smr family endonuclease n=1 Tax=Sphingobium vermicomposti TaxID=529005 RepID=A0A846M664_9SPHN|nr:Smr/MutS family protein [Sphingobium vermicomposti]NIJ17392.1 DNA-nicking Smr family endonuclease [Sphingobium vermicomposti]